MSVSLSDANAFTLWQHMLKHIKKYGQSYTDRRKRTCYEILNMIVTLTSTSDLTKPVEKLRQFDKWIYPDPEEISTIFFLGRQNLPYSYNYGMRLFHFQKQFNQIDNFIIPLLREQPFTRKAVVTVFDPAIDCDTKRDETPAICTVHFLIRGGKLHLTAYIRSCDVFIGFPANLYQLHLLQEYVAKKLQREIATVTLHLGSAHIFDDYDEQMNYILL